MKFSVPFGPPQIMGVVNLTPDSFYAGSRHAGIDLALKAVERMVEEGADMLDLGAESSRPGSQGVSVQEEKARLLPVLEQVIRRYRLPVSVDTWKSEVAEAALDLGASCINDITGLAGSPEMAATIARHDRAVILMHMRGTPETMQNHLEYDDLFAEISGFFREALEKAQEAGINPEKIALDPGIGFGKGVEDNLRLVNGLDRFQALGKPLVLGVSRKSFIGKVLDLPVEQRLEGSLAAALIGLQRGANILRVHDVAATRRAVDMARAILEEGLS